MKRSDKRRAEIAARGTGDKATVKQVAGGGAAGPRAESEAARPLFYLSAVSAAALMVRSYAASRIGFGDSEALYATYAQHPQAAYLDHPGLVGNAMRTFVQSAPPFTIPPQAVHAATAFLATLVPWVFVLVARLAGASWARAARSALVVAVVPEVAVGLFALTPDLLLAFLWPMSIGLALYAVGEKPGETRGAVAWATAFFLAGAAATAKVSGLLLVLALVLFLFTSRGRSHAKSLGPWFGVLAAIVTVTPVFLYERLRGWPMLHHRLVDTQTGFGPSWRNIGALVLGQLGYLGPVAAVLAVIVLVRLARALKTSAEPDAETVLLGLVTFVPLAGLVPFALLSRVAEAHWIAPGLLALPLFAAIETPSTSRSTSRSLGAWSFATGLAITIGAHLWVLVPKAASLLPESRERQLDIASELYGWPQVISVTRAMADEEAAHSGQAPIVIAPHWVLSAQLAAGLGPNIPVACDMDVPTDFDDWVPRERWQKADALLVVTDARFPLDPETRYPSWHVQSARTVSTFRGGRVIRNFRLALMYREAIGSR